MAMLRRGIMNHQKNNTQNLLGIRRIRAKEIRLIVMMKVRQNKNLTNNQSLRNLGIMPKISLIKATALKKIREIRAVKEMVVDLEIDESLN